MKKKILIGIGIFFFLLVMLYSCAPGIEEGGAFDTAAKERFATILESSPELNSITCLDNVCNSVAYFDYNTVPDDLEFVVGTNASTFSTFKKEELGASHVTIIATYNGSTILTYNASSGTVDDCE